MLGAGFTADRLARSEVSLPRARSLGAGLARAGPLAALMP